MLNIKRNLLSHLYRHLFAFGFWALLQVQANAQVPVLSQDTSAENQELTPTWPVDSLGRRTPRGTVNGFIKAVAEENYVRAAQYLSIDSALRKDQDSVVLARSLQQLLDKDGSILPYSLLSDKPEGHEDDNLGPDLDRVGVATVNNEQFDLILEKTTDADGAPLWLFSSETIKRVPVPVKEAPIAPVIEEVTPNILKDKKWGGVPLGHWLGMLLLIVASYFTAWGITRLILYLIPLGWRKARTEPTSGIIVAFALPIRLYLTVWLFVWASQEAGISIIARQRFGNIAVIVGIVAVVLLLWQLLDSITRFVQRRVASRGNQAGVSALLFLRRAAKVALIVLAGIWILDTVGVDVTTGLAALGIGGIALALGAQKTMENFVGSVTLIADQPIRVGDFCKVGDTVGTVEQIGMRSSQVRTLDRTIVTIPNGDFSSQKIENFAHRDRFWFHPTFHLRYDTTPDQIRYLLVELRAILYAHPKVSPDPARVRFVEIGRDSLKLEVFSYVLAADFDRFLEIQEDLYLRMMDIVAASGTGFALPSQALYISRNQQPSDEKMTEVEEQVKKWREEGDMQIPNFTPDRIQELKNTIPYPPDGSSMNR